METTTKVCTKCKVEKSCDIFSNDKTTKDGLRYWCKQCVKKHQQENRDKLREYRKKWHQENPDKIRGHHKKYQQENADKIREYQKKYQQENPDKRKEYNKKYRQENPDKKRESAKKWRKQNPEYSKEYQKNRLQSDPIYKMITNIRNRISQYCRVIKLNKTTKTKDMLGIDLLGFQLYMESKFQEGMNWDNYGKWHVDHIKPISLATTEQEIIELNRYTNLQPLWAAENLKKSNKYEKSH